MEVIKKINKLSLLWFVFILVGLSYTFEHSYKIGWPYDFNLIDFNFVNNVLLLLKGEPIYSNWKEGYVLNMYPPLYTYILAFLHLVTLKYFNLFALARSLNLFLFMGSYILLGAIAFKRFRFYSQAYQCASLFFTYFIFNHAIGLYLWEISYLRTDPLLFFMTMVSCYLLSFHTEKIVLVVAISFLCPLIKQSGVIIPVSALLFYILFERKYFLPFMIRLLLISFFVLVGIEIHNKGNFIYSTFIWPSHNYSTMISFNYFLNVIGDYYWKFPLLPLLIILSFYFSPKVKGKGERFSIVLIFIIDLLLLLKIGQNKGGGYNYYYLHYALASILGGQTVTLILYKGNCFIKDQSLVKKIKIGMVVIFFFTALTSLSPLKRYKNFQKGVQLLEKLKPEKARDNLKIQNLIKLYPEKKWLVIGGGDHLLKANILLDQEMSTHILALENNNSNIDQFLMKLTNGQYEFILGTFNTLPIVQSIVDRYFEKIDQLIHYDQLQIPMEFILYKYKSKEDN